MSGGGAGRSGRGVAVAFRRVGGVIISALGYRRSGIAVRTDLARSLRTSDLSTIRLGVTLRSTYNISVPSRRLTGLGAINSVCGCVATRV